MTPQEIFDKAVKHVLMMPDRAVNPKTGACKYRTEDGRSCIVGGIMPKKTYRKWMDNGDQTAIDNLMKANGPHFPKWMRDNVNLLSRLQTVHDRETNWPHYRLKHRLTEVAADFGLDPSIVNTAPVYSGASV